MSTAKDVTTVFTAINAVMDQGDVKLAMRLMHTIPGDVYGSADTAPLALALVVRITDELKRRGLFAAPDAAPSFTYSTDPDKFFTAMEAAAERRDFAQVKAMAVWGEEHIPITPENFERLVKVTLIIAKQRAEAG